MTLLNLIEGRAEAPALGLSREVCDANTGEALFVQRASSPAQIERALILAAVTHADNAWMRQPAQQRAADLERVAEQILLRAEAIAMADAQATGVVISLTSQFAQVCAGAFRQAAQLVRAPPQPIGRDGPHGALAIERLPLGPAAIIAPWNAPAGIAAHKLASALAAGCPVLLKPSEWAPLSAQLITEAVCAAGLPAGMLQLLHGGAEVGATLVRDARVRAVSFTGGLAGGRAVAAACAEQIKPAQLELGGNNPLIVLDDADLDAAISGVVAGLTTLNGQWCRALGRLLVHRSLIDPLLEGVMQRLALLRLGSSLETDSQMGPMVSRGHRDHVTAQLAHLQALGGQVRQSTPLPDLAGWFLAPTLVTGLAPESTLDEIFGPVATVHGFDDDEEAVALANQTPYGLAAYVFGAEDRAWAVARQLRAGLIKINAVTLLNLHPQAPRPAWGLSGLGDEGTLETFEFFRGTRVIGVAARPAAAAA
jgi:acyl-CoA reductase-like NAD-dependent aldehyde dehydrogenase